MQRRQAALLVVLCLAGPGCGVGMLSGPEATDPPVAEDGGYPDVMPAPDAGPEPDEGLAPVEPTKHLVLWDTSLQKEPSSDAAASAKVLRGSRVERIAGQPQTDGFFNVTFADGAGWIAGKKVAAIFPDATRREVALAYPKAFFKRQVRHPVWNPTGPSTSGNCAPASLAMGAMVFGRQPAGLTVEQSIDRVRRLMDKPSDSGGASLAQVRKAAAALNLEWRAMARGELDADLDKGRMVVLVGTPGNTSSPTSVTTYQRAFRDAGYTYTFDGAHSILVMARMPSGKYLVADPLSKIGPLEISKAAMRDFYARWGGSGTSVWRPE